MAALLAFIVVGSVAGGATVPSSAEASVVAPVDLRGAGSFAILSMSGVTDVPSSVVTGDVGSSPITGAAILLTCPEVTGLIVSVDAAGPACKTTDATRLTTAIGDMGAAYTDAAGRQKPDFVNLGGGEIGGQKLVAGLYRWTTGVTISTDVTLTGTSNSVFIFQIAGSLSEAAATRVSLVGGVLPQNVFWQTAEGVTLGTTAHCEGVILSKTMIAMKTGASISGRLLAQTAVTLQSNTVTAPTHTVTAPTPTPTPASATSTPATQ